MLRVTRLTVPSSRLPRSAPLRCVHLSPPRFATEVPRNPLEDPTVSAVIDKIRNHQGAIDAVMNLRKVFEAKGVFSQFPQRRGMKLTIGRVRYDEAAEHDADDEDGDGQRVERQCHHGERLTRLEVFVVDNRLSSQLMEELKNAGVDLNPDVSLGMTSYLDGLC